MCQPHLCSLDLFNTHEKRGRVWYPISSNKCWYYKRQSTTVNFKLLQFNSTLRLLLNSLEGLGIISSIHMDSIWKINMARPCSIMLNYHDLPPLLPLHMGWRWSHAIGSQALLLSHVLGKRSGSPGPRLLLAIATHTCSHHVRSVGPSCAGAIHTHVAGHIM